MTLLDSCSFAAGVCSSAAPGWMASTLARRASMAPSLSDLRATSPVIPTSRTPLCDFGRRH
eukprot:10555113-Alexandrium_andersonii.AAC.1